MVPKASGATLGTQVRSTSNPQGGVAIQHEMKVNDRQGLWHRFSFEFGRNPVGLLHSAASSLRIFAQEFPAKLTQLGKFVGKRTGMNGAYSVV